MPPTSRRPGSGKAVNGHRTRKRFGQNFLHDPGIIDRILQHIAPQPDQHLVEIGPGLGALTQGLLESAGQVTALELDRDLVPRLQQRFADFTNFDIQQTDALRFDFRVLAQKGPIRVVGNLPYNISTPLIFHLLEQRQVITDMHFMLQKEVVERMGAAPGHGTYGRLSVMVQYYCEVDTILHVGPGAFQPAPKVDSAVVRLQPRRQPQPECRNPDQFGKIVSLAFNQRRKTLRNSLKSVIESEQWQALPIDPATRPEQLSVAEFVTLSNLLIDRSNEIS